MLLDDVLVANLSSPSHYLIGHNCNNMSYQITSSFLKKKLIKFRLLKLVLKRLTTDPFYISKYIYFDSLYNIILAQQWFTISWSHLQLSQHTPIAHTNMHTTVHPHQSPSVPWIFHTPSSVSAFMHAISSSWNIFLLSNHYRLTLTLMC